MVIAITNNQNIKHGKYPLHYRSYPDCRMGDWLFWLCSWRSYTYTPGDCSSTLSREINQEGSVNQLTVKSVAGLIFDFFSTE